MVFLLVPRAGFDDNESPQIALASRPNPKIVLKHGKKPSQSHVPNAVWDCWDPVMAGVHTRMNCKSPLNTPLETFALGQCVPSWTLRKSLRQRGIESNWLVKGTTLICARDVGH